MAVLVPWAAQATAAQSASDQKFARAQMLRLSNEFDRQLASAKEAQQLDYDRLEKLFEVQKDGIDTMQEALDINAKYDQDWQRYWQDDFLPTANQYFDGLDAAAALLDPVARQNYVLWGWYQWHNTGRSAGGKITDGVTGFPAHTGEIRPTTIPLEGGWPVGWLPCTGLEVPITQFPELYSILGNRFGAASSPDLFKLPSKSDFTGSGGKAYVFEANLDMSYSHRETYPHSNQGTPHECKAIGVAAEAMVVNKISYRHGGGAGNTPDNEHRIWTGWIPGPAPGVVGLRLEAGTYLPAGPNSYILYRPCDWEAFEVVSFVPNLLYATVPAGGIIGLVNDGIVGQVFYDFLVSIACTAVSGGAANDEVQYLIRM